MKFLRYLPIISNEARGIDQTWKIKDSYIELYEILQKTYIVTESTKYWKLKQKCVRIVKSINPSGTHITVPHTERHAGIHKQSNTLRKNVVESGSMCMHGERGKHNIN